MKDWSQLGLDPRLTQVVSEVFQFTRVMPVQEASIPLFCKNSDVCVEACTGSGKTLAYLLPVFHKLLQLKKPPKGTFALVIAPSRELAQQIHEVACKINEALGSLFTLMCMVGGHRLPEDIERLQAESPQIIIATPGRLSDLMDKVEDFRTNSLEVLILDEADRLLDSDFQITIHRIIERLPKQRRTGLFSATMSADVNRLVRAGLRNPVYIEVKIKSRISDTRSGSTQQPMPEGLSNFYLTFPSAYEKLPALAGFLSEHRQSKVIVFFCTCASTNYYALLFQRLTFLQDVPVFRLHGKMKQSQRERVYEQFEALSSGVILTTDLLARGIDLPAVDWVVQFDPPKDPDYYVHRVGRTARAGTVGRTLLMILSSEEAYIPFLQGRQVPLEAYSEELTEVPVYEEVQHLTIDDREVLEAAQQAFVAYVRFYKEHQLGYIFEFKHLDLGYLASSFSLLRIPRIKEILGKQIDTFTQSDIDPESIKFKDKAKEKQRLLGLEE